ncbi:MAG: glycosyltransferase family 2 protein [Nitrospirae bacterium]|nr:glycosyltransferase family 2 protein [Nitrospirota bacterium]
MLSAIVITKNEEKNIKRCLSGLLWCDEIIVVDSGSTDNTLEIAKGFTDRIYVENWKGYGPQKQSALEKARGEWVFSIDADEVVTEALSEEIKKTVSDTTRAGFYIPRKNFYKDKWLRHGGQYPDYVLRLFRRGSGRFSPSMVHEKVIIDGPCGRLKEPLLHYTFQDLSSLIDKINKYSSLSAKELFQAGRRCGALSPFMHFLSFFIRDYILRLGFLDGIEGFNVAFVKALGIYLKYAKLRDMTK